MTFRLDYLNSRFVCEPPPAPLILSEDAKTIALVAIVCFAAIAYGRSKYLEKQKQKQLVAFFRAIDQRNHAELQRLLRQDPTLIQRGPRCLRDACRSTATTDPLPIFRLLLEHGADIGTLQFPSDIFRNFTDLDQKRALLELLIARGADRHIKDQNGLSIQDRRLSSTAPSTTPTEIPEELKRDPSFPQFYDPIDRDLILDPVMSPVNGCIQKRESCQKMLEEFTRLGLDLPRYIELPQIRGAIHNKITEFVAARPRGRRDDRGVSFVGTGFLRPPRSCPKPALTPPPKSDDGVSFVRRGFLQRPAAPPRPKPTPTPPPKSDDGVSFARRGFLAGAGSAAPPKPKETSPPEGGEQVTINRALLVACAMITDPAERSRKFEEYIAKGTDLFILDTLGKEIIEYPKPSKVAPEDYELPDEIPETYEGMTDFPQFICPISFSLVTDPVLDPTNGITIYERSAIVRHLNNERRSPMTRLPLEISQLVNVPNLAREIKNHYYSKDGDREGVSFVKIGFLQAGAGTAS